MAPFRSNSIDLTFRPLSYWAPPDPASAVLQNIKGQMRRRMVRDFLDGTAPAILGDIDPDLLADEVDDHTRRFLGRLHPSWMGGEYLPGYGSGEVEIARIALKSTTGDVISFRARRRTPASPIRYRVVDEYETPYTPTRRTSRRPLTLRQLIRFIDEAGTGVTSEEYPFVESLIENGADGDISFATVESMVYPELQRYYEERLAAWARARAPMDPDEDEAFED